jgi:peptide/nickel transport system ATP-binding protein
MLEVKNLVTSFENEKTGELVKACDDVTLTVGASEFVGLVGESGCGKSTLGRTIVGLEKASSGQINFDGVDLLKSKAKQRREYSRKVQYIFQDSYAALNPRQTVGQSLDEALQISGERNSAARQKRIRSLLGEVGLLPNLIDRYARELSGGQRQRVCIARALVPEPKLIICDEPVASLDVSIRAQIMNLFRRLQDDNGVAFLFIAHDLAVVRQAAMRVYVMYLGQIVEAGDTQSIYDRPLHPYTQALLAAVPNPDPRIERKRAKILLAGEVPNPAHPPSGCRFRTRCPAAVALCASPPDPSKRNGRIAACHFAGKVKLAPAA